jgi:two-component system cell cycle sensor histidine kinase PleC
MDISNPSAVSDDASRWLAHRLAAAWPTLDSSLTCAHVYDWFENRSDQPAAAVLDRGDAVVGLVNRVLFLSSYAQRYYPELYGRRSILALANRNPLVVDENVSVAEVGAALVFERPAALLEGFVVTSGGKYYGIGTGEALMRSKVALLQQREQELRMALRTATEASRAKTNFLALMSHELRTPLNAIIGFSEILRDEHFGPLGNRRYGGYSAHIHSAGKHLLSLINDILDVSKAEAGKLELHFEAVSLPQLIGECVNLTEGKAREGQLTLTKHCAESVTSLLGDELRLKQIIINLLSNAMKFTPAGGQVSVGVDTDASGGLCLFVKDTGIGMPQELIPVALEPFRQLGSPRARRFEGSGLGLSLVKSLAELHQAKLAIQSEVGKGTQVRVLFPASRNLPSQGWGFAAAQKQLAG